MEPLNDQELNRLLRQWEAPSAPATLRIPNRRTRPSRWSWLWNGSIRVPVPIGVGAVVIVALFWVFSASPSRNPPRRILERR
jgi:hypothetical protein